MFSFVIFYVTINENRESFINVRDIMNSRMDKYQTGTIVKERTVRNKKLYENVPDVNVDYITLENGIEIKPSSSLKNKRSDYQKMKELEDIMPIRSKQETVIEPKENKQERVYDINEILRQAKENKLFQEDDRKRLINTEYNILTKLDIEKINQAKDLKKEDLKNLIDQIYDNEGDQKHKKKKTRTAVLEEDDKDLLADLKDDSDVLPIEDKTVELPMTDTLVDGTLELEIDAEISKKILDKENKEKEKDSTDEKIAKLIKKENVDLETNFKSQDFKTKEEETIPTDEILIENKKSNVMLVVIVLFVIVLISVVAYLLYRYFFA